MFFCSVLVLKAKAAISRRFTITKQIIQSGKQLVKYFLLVFYYQNKKKRKKNIKIHIYGHSMFFSLSNSFRNSENEIAGSSTFAASTALFA